jgi:lanosterol synthase
MIITLYATQTPVPQEWKIEIARYLANYQRKGGSDDQGWGLYVRSTSFPVAPSSDIWYRHVEGPSTVYGTAMNYVTMRLLGVDKDEPSMVRARATLHALGKPRIRVQHTQA